MTKIKFSLELEQRVLENLMDIGDPENARVQNAFLILITDCFYVVANAELFALVKDSFVKKEHFGFVDMLVKIGQQKPEVHHALTLITDNYRQYFYSNACLEADIQKLISLNILRKQMQTIKNTVRNIDECENTEQSQELIAQHLKDVHNLGYSQQQTKLGVNNTEIAESYYDGTLVNDTIIPTTCLQLNELLGGGIMSKSLITIAAGAGVGKTGFSVFLMDAISRNQPGSQNLFFSLEMESKHIWMRHVGILAKKQFEQLTDMERLEAVAKELQVRTKMFDCATCPASSDIDFILNKSRINALEKPISVIVVDYLGLVENKGSFERNDLRQADITTKLAKLALELNCVVIALSQINRASTTRATDDRCPYPQDAADSSGSHRSSTLWLGVDRPELYLDDPCYRNQFVIKCRKNRFGGTFELKLAFNDGTFSEVNPHYFKKPFSPTKSNQDKLFA